MLDLSDAGLLIMMQTYKLKSLLMELGLAVNKRCVGAFESNLNLSSEVKVSPVDIIYRIDIEAEEEIVRILEAKAADFGGIVLLAEGIGEDDKSIYPSGISESDAAVKIICDPIDGSRGLMYGKRPAFFLTAAGAASAETLKDMTVSVMVEIPIPKQTEFDVLSAVRGEGAENFRYKADGSSVEKKLIPSDASSIEGGFISFVKYCYPGKDYVSILEERFLDQIFADKKEHFLPVFEDQYISSGGQLYELICGHDRLIFDIRGAMYAKFKREGRKVGQVSHPYDMAGVLIAEEYGIVVNNLDGTPFDAPLEMTYDVDWLGYSNKNIQNQCEGILADLMKAEGLI
jgi:fructose-1,6-bisphosphatase/inositol monophosphatase family enzyme